MINLRFIINAIIAMFLVTNLYAMEEKSEPWGPSAIIIGSSINEFGFPRATIFNGLFVDSQHLLTCAHPDSIMNGGNHFVMPMPPNGKCGINIDDAIEGKQVAGLDENTLIQLLQKNRRNDIGFNFNSTYNNMSKWWKPVHYSKVAKSTILGNYKQLSPNAGLDEEESIFAINIKKMHNVKQINKQFKKRQANFMDPEKVMSTKIFSNSYRIEVDLALLTLEHPIPDASFFSLDEIEIGLSKLPLNGQSFQAINEGISENKSKELTWSESTRVAFEQYNDNKTCQLTKDGKHLYYLTQYGQPSLEEGKSGSAMFVKGLPVALASCEKILSQIGEEGSIVKEISSKYEQETPVYNVFQVIDKESITKIRKIIKK